MSKRKSILGILIASAMCICAVGAFGVSSASALTMHECTEASGTTGSYTTSECSVTSETGKFHWVPIVGKQTLTPTATTNFTLGAVVGGVKFKIVCTALGGTATAENTEAAGEMKIVGTGVAEYSGCSVSEPAGKSCVVANPIKTVELSSTTKEMKFTYTPKSGEKFTTIVVSGCTVTALNGEKEVKGTAVAEVEEPGTGTEMGTAGTTQKFTETSGSTLTFGGQAATFLGSLHYSTANGTKVAALTP